MMKLDTAPTRIDSAVKAISKPPKAVKQPISAKATLTTLTDKQAARKAALEAFKAEQSIMEAYEDLRDDVMRLVDNSRMSYEDIHAKFGPHPATLKAWSEKSIKKPQLGKLQSVLRILGKDIGIVDLRIRPK